MANVKIRDPKKLELFFGKELAAIYGVALVFTQFLRPLYSTIFNPFVARFNHFIGLKKRDSMIFRPEGTI